MPKENEKSIPFHQYKHTLSKSSSSGSTRADSFEEREKQRVDLSERLRIAEEDARKLEKENEKLEHKLKEAKMAAANVAETEVNSTCIWIDTSIYTCTCIDLATCIYPCWIVYTLYMYIQYFYLNVTQFLIQTDLTVRLSVAEEDAHKLKKENEKLERKLKEAEMVAAQADVAGTEVHVHVHCTYRHIHCI